MRIVQISDLHFTRFTLHFFSKRLIGLLNWLLFRQREVDETSLDPLPLLWRELQVDLIIVAGDLTSTSLPSEFEEAHRFFAQCEQPKLFIPGNHDHYTEQAFQQKRFYRFFSNSSPLPDFSLATHGVEAHRLGSWGWCVALDTAIPTSFTSSHGLFSEQLEHNLEQLLSHLGPTDSILLLNHFPFFQHGRPEHRLERGDQLRALIERHPNIRLYLHGHTHQHVIADLAANRLPLILDSGCPVQISGSTWNLIDLEPTHCTVRAYLWDNQWKPFREHISHWPTP